MTGDEHIASAARLIERCAARGVMIATAESCTGGLISAVLTAVAGSSQVVDRGFVTYSNASKTEMLGVPAHLIAAHGAVSEPVARAMASGALAAAPAAGVSVSVTGIAGPGGGSTEKPVGLVHIAVAVRTADGATMHHEACRFGDIGRDRVRADTVARALAMIGEALAAEA